MAFNFVKAKNDRKLDLCAQSSGHRVAMEYTGGYQHQVQICPVWCGEPTELWTLHQDPSGAADLGSTHSAVPAPGGDERLHVAL
jgi:hypothetical protein